MNEHANASPADQRQRHLGLLLFDGVEELDAVGPWEVLAYWTLQHPEDGWAISCLSADGREVTGGCSETPRTWTGCEPNEPPSPC